MCLQWHRPDVVIRGDPFRAIAGQARPAGVTVRVTAGEVGYLPQRLDVLDDTLSLIDNLRSVGITRWLRLDAGAGLTEARSA